MTAMTSRKLPLTLLLMIVIASACFLIQLKPVSSTFPGTNGKIVFVRGLGAAVPVPQIFTVNPDGSGLTQLTFAGDNYDPHWSADGTKIVFVHNSDIWIMNADGLGQTRITQTQTNYEPAFSPDGSKIVFRSSGRIWVINTDGTNQKALTAGPSDRAPIWSPDGFRIAFVRPVSSWDHIFVMNAADGSGLTDITNLPSGTADEYPEWSPDGRIIAFRGYPGFAIWVMNSDGSGRKQLSNPPNGLVDAFPAWSPDGTKIAFNRELDSIWVMNADGSNPIDITQGQPNSDSDHHPSWQPLKLPPVGGVVMPTSKLEILTPYLALAGLIVAVSAVVAVKRRRD